MNTRQQTYPSAMPSSPGRHCGFLFAPVRAVRILFSRTAMLPCSAVLLLLLGMWLISATATARDRISFDASTRLGSDCVMDMAQDRYGRVWMATTGGLSLYDGNGLHTFTRSRVPEAHSLVANDLNRVWPDPKEPVVWIATQRDGLDAYNYRTGIFTHYRQHDGAGSIADNSVTSISPSSGGGLWLTSYMGGLSHYNRSTDDFTRLNRRAMPSLVSDAMWCALETTDSLLFVGHVRDGLSRIDLRTHGAAHIPVISCFPDRTPAEDGVRALAADSCGRLWLATERGLACLPSRHATRPVAMPRIRGLVCHLGLSGDSLLISTRDMGLWVLRLTDVRFGSDGQPQLRSPHTLHPIPQPCFGEGETPLVRCALADSFGNLWVGTDRKGVQVELYEPRMFRYEDTGRTVIRSLARDARGRIWTGSQSEGITVTAADGTVRQFTTANSALGSNTINALLPTPDGDMWIGTEMQGLYRWNHRNNTIHKVMLTDTQGGHTIYVWSLCLWRGQLAVGTYQGLFVVQPDTEAFRCYTERNSALPDPYIFSLLTDRQGRLWCGSALKGLMVMEDSTLTDGTRIPLPDRLGGKAITSMMEAGDGSVWAATEDGLARIKAVATGPGTADVQVWQEAEGIAHPTIQTLCELPDGRIACSTPDGLYIIGMDADGQAPHATLCFCLPPTNGQAFRMNAALRLDGRHTLWAGNGRLTTYTGSNDHRTLPCHHLLVEPTGPSSFTAVLCVPDAAQADKVKARYRIDGGDWTETDGTRRFTIDHPDGGRHRVEAELQFIGCEWTGQATQTGAFDVPRSLGMRILAITLPLLALLATGTLVTVRHRQRQRTQRHTLLSSAPPADNAQTDSRADNAPRQPRTSTAPHPTGEPYSVPQMPEALPLSATDADFLQKAAATVDRLMTETSLDKNTLAQELCMSASTLYRRLKTATGMSPNEYIRHRRLLSAHRLLMEGHSVSDTAARVGMSITYLGRCYKEEFGVSPSEVRP
ncbi:MAG: helix-turn-helix domain-containing protein [Clostridium sp.]|nr:helix-turn-helix domain-containing protein [Clostridium sp.]